MICQRTSAMFFHRRDSAKAMHFQWAKYLVQIQPVSAPRKHCHTEAGHVMLSMTSPRGWQYDKAVTPLTKLGFHRFLHVIVTQLCASGKCWCVSHQLVLGSYS